jgi:sarcosine oxidase subunit gamma
VHNLTAITPLGGASAQIDSHGTATCTEVTDLALASVAARLGHEKACAAALKTILGTDAPGPGKSAMGDPYTAVWMGPEQWIIGASFSTHEDIEDQMKAALKDAASVTEQSDMWCGYDLSGTGLQSVMELLCNINIRAMAPGDATRTAIHHLGCIVVCGDPDGFFRIIGPRSSAGSLHHAIVTAMKSAL